MVTCASVVFFCPSLDFLVSLCVLFGPLKDSQSSTVSNCVPVVAFSFLEGQNVAFLSFFVLLHFFCSFRN